MRMSTDWLESLSEVTWGVAAETACEALAIALFVAAMLFGLPLIGLGLGLAS